MEASILGCNLPSSAFNGHNVLFFSLSAPPPVGLKLRRGEAGLMSSCGSDWMVFYRADDVRLLEVGGSALVGQWTGRSLAVRTAPSWAANTASAPWWQTAINCCQQLVSFFF